MELIIVYLIAGIFLILLWVFILDPFLEGLGGFVRNLRRQLFQEDKPFPPEDRQPGSPEAPDTKSCPFCAETIKKAAKICRFCKSPLD